MRAEDGNGGTHAPVSRDREALRVHSSTSMPPIPGSIGTIIKSQEERKQEEDKAEEGSRAWEREEEFGHRWGIRCRLHSVRIVRAVSRTVRSMLEKVKVRLRVQTKDEKENEQKRAERKGQRGKGGEETRQSAIYLVMGCPSCGR